MTDNQIKGDLSRDTFYRGKVEVLQHKKGYRFSVDAPILADFLPPGSQAALEVGTGCGIISLLALFKNKYPIIHGLELQPALADLAVRNGEINGFSQRFKVVRGDFKELHAQFRGIHTIFANPPYLPLGRGRQSPNPEIRQAKMEVSLKLNHLMNGSCSILAEGGVLILILPFVRYQEVLTLAEECGLFATHIRYVFSIAGGNPERFLIQLTNSRKSCQELPPLVIFREEGVYTDEMEKILAG